MVLERILTERGIDRFVVVTSPYQDRSAAPFSLTPNDASPRSETPSYTNGARAPIRGGAAGSEPRRGR
jgi:hypothetical protein